MKDAEDVSNVGFHLVDGENATLFPLCDAAAIASNLSAEQVRDTSDVP